MFIEYQIHLFIDSVILPILLVLGIAGNTFMIIVLLKNKSRDSSTGRLLLALVISDIFVLVISVPYKWLDTTYGINIRDFSDLGCRTHLFLTLQAGQLSVLYIATISVERFVFVMLPYKAKTICTGRNINIIILVLLLVSLILSGHTLYGVGLTDNDKCAPIDKIYQVRIWRVWQILNVVGIVFVPFTIMVLSNTCIITKLVFGNCTSNACLGTKRKQNRLAVKKKASQVTVTLMLVILTFIICVIPLAIYYIMFSGDQWEHGTTHHDALVLLFWSVSSALYHTNSAVNFLIYFLSASKFRKEIKDLCCLKQAEMTHFLNEENTPSNQSVESNQTVESQVKY